MIEEYNNEFLKFVGDLQLFMKDLDDNTASVINSALHEFDVNIRKILENGALSTENKDGI